MRLQHWLISAALATCEYPAAAVATTVTTLHEFQASDGYALDAGLVRAPDGTLYGATQTDLGPKGAGVIYQLKPDGLGAYQYSVIYRFCAKRRCSDGAGPAPGARLVLRQGKLYGTTMGGGMGYGVAYELASDPVTGAWKLTVLHAFDGAGERAMPLERASLAFGPDGTLYGTAWDWFRGAGGFVYALTPAAEGSRKRLLRIIHTFSNEPGSDGKSPTSGVVVDRHGALFGTTREGGNSGCMNGDGCGTVYRLEPPSVPGGEWTKTVLYRFKGRDQGDGWWPDAAPTLYRNGTLVGTTIEGVYCGGVAYCLAPPKPGQTEWTETIIADFGQAANPPCSTPNSSLAVAADGSLIGTAYPFSGTYPGGLYRIAPPPLGTHAWSVSNLWLTRDQPIDGVAIDPSGSLFGVTVGGGLQSPECLQGCGTVFRVEP